MPCAISEKKARLRRQLRGELAALTGRAREESDRALSARFLALPELERAGTVFAFWGVPDREVDTSALIAALLARGKAVGLPRMLPGRGMEVRRYDPERPLVPARFGILEPGEDCPVIAREEIGLVLIPALCYDRRGYRLGSGGGYYDRWLASFSGVGVGLCREAVLRERLPAGPRDSRAQIVLTETERLSIL